MVKSPTHIAIVLTATLLLVFPVYADGTLQYGTCGLEQIADIDGSPVAAGSLVQLWDTSTGQIIDDTAQIGDGIIGSPPGRFAANVSLPDGNYNLKIRVYNTASPDGSPSTCAVVVGGSGRGSAGIDVAISAGSPQTVCFNSAQIPNQSYVSGEGGCSASAICPDFDAPLGVVGLEDVQAVAGHWRQADTNYDVDGDGDVDVADIERVVAAWGPCP